MVMRPALLLAFGELIRRGGSTADGTRLVPKEWIETSWTKRTTSRITGDGYGWFLREIKGEIVPYGWCFGGQMLYVIPSHDLTIVVTSDESLPSADAPYLDELAQMVGYIMLALDGRP